MKELAEGGDRALPVGSTLRYFIADVKGTLPVPEDRCGFAPVFLRHGREKLLMPTLTYVAELGVGLLTELQELYDDDDCDCCDRRRECEHHWDCACSHELTEPSSALQKVLDDIALRVDGLRPASLG